MYEFRIGDEGNTTTVLRKKMHAKPVAAAPSMPCARSTFTAYWITVRPGNGADVATDVAMGVGSVCGTGTILRYTEPAAEPITATADTTADTKADTAAAAATDADATGTASSTTKKAVEVLPRYVSFTCLQHRAHFRSIVLTAVPARDVAVHEPQECFPRVPGRCVCKFNNLQFVVQEICVSLGSTDCGTAVSQHCRSSSLHNQYASTLSSCFWLSATDHEYSNRQCKRKLSSWQSIMQ
jgi:hypothetical protein